MGRRQELTLLEREYGRPRPSLIVVRGRRRVGKSTLLLHSLRDRPSVYYQASRLTAADNLALFRQAVVTALGDDPVLAGLSTWPALLAYLAEQARTRPGLTVVLDEFPYLADAEPALPSLIQGAWDRIQATGLPLKLVLCGSSISFMAELLAERNPLHGRQTLDIDLAPLSYREAGERFGDWPLDERLKAYGVFGGMPYYLALCDPTRTLQQNVEEVILERGAPLHDEPTHLLQSELTSVARYASVLRAVADGCTQWGEIVSRLPELGSGSQLAPYMTRLEGLRLIDVSRSLDNDERARNRRYRLGDPFLAFWYHFVLPHRSALEAGHVDWVYGQRIAPQLDRFLGATFEGICRDFMRRYGQEVFGVPAREVGSIWAADYDLDVAATLLDGRVVYGECKWWEDLVGLNVLGKLRESAQKTRYGGGEAELALFSRRGFTSEVQGSGVTLVDLPRLYGGPAA
nr:ATP-binding protein [Deinococcus aestuarii]